MEDNSSINSKVEDTGLGEEQRLTQPGYKYSTSLSAQKAMAFTRDGSCIVIGMEGKIGICLSPTGYLIEEKVVHAGYLRSLVMAHDGKYILSVGYDGNLTKTLLAESERNFDPYPVSSRRRLETTYPTFLAISHNSEVVATNGRKNAVDLFHTNPLEPKGSITQILNKPTGAVFDPNDAVLLVGDSKGRLYACNLVSYRVDASWEAHATQISSMVFDIYNKCFITSSRNGEITIWDSTSYSEIQKVILKSSITSLIQSPDGKYLFVGTSDGFLHILDQSLSPIDVPLSARGSVRSLAIDRKGKHLAAGLSNGFQVWDLHDIRQMKMAYDEPGRLKIDLRFDDGGELIPNNAIDGGEQPVVHVVIENYGSGEAYDVVLEVESDNVALSHGKRYNIGDIRSGNTFKQEVLIKAPLDIEDGLVNMNFRAVDSKGAGDQKALLIDVFHLPKPELSITRIELDDHDRGYTRGNGNGVPENDEIIELEVFVNNTGAGSTLRQTIVSIDKSSLSEGVILHKDSEALGSIAKNRTESARLRIEIPRDYDQDNLSVTVNVENRVTQTGTSIYKTWPVRNIVPILQARLESPHQLTNASSAKLVVRVKNIGEIKAEDVNVSLAVPHGVTVDRSSATIGGLNVNEEYSCEFVIAIQATYSEPKAIIDVNVNQKHFSASRETKSFDVEIKRPDLRISDAGTARIRQGSDFILDFMLSNDGDYDASDVQARVVIEALAYNRQHPVGKISKMGVIPLQVEHRVPLNYAAGTMIEARVILTQKDFGEVKQIFKYEVERADPAVARVASTTTKQSERDIRTRQGAPGRKTASLTSSISDSDDTVVRSVPYRLTIAARSPEGIQEILLKVNDDVLYRLSASPIDLDRLQRIGGEFLQTDVDIRRLKTGRNEIVISMRDKNNNFTEDKWNIEFVPTDKIATYGRYELDPNIDVNIPPEYSNNNPDAVAIIVGISRYQSPEIPPVDYAVLDGLAIKEYLVKAFGVKPSNIIELYDEKATKTGIEVAVKADLQARIKKGESDVYFYFSGHGGPSDNQGYIIPYDGDPRPRSIKLSGYALRDLYRDLDPDNLLARSVHVFIDACFSGYSPRGMLFQDVSPVVIETSDKFVGADSFLLTASGSGEFSMWKNEKNHGMFTYYFLRGLRGEADYDGNKVITYEEIIKYLRSNVSREAEIRKIEQNPVFHGDGDQVLLRLK